MAAGAGVAPGFHAKVAFSTGSRNPAGGRRGFGFNIGVDFHGTIIPGGVLLFPTLGIGGELY